MTHSALVSIQQAVRQRVEEEGLRPLSDRTGIPVGQLRSICDGRATLSTTIERVSDALNLEFYIGSPRDLDHLRSGPWDAEIKALSPVSLRDMETGARTLNRIVVDAGGDPMPDELWSALAHPPAANDAGVVPGARPVDIVELGAAAGGGADAASEEVTGCVWFRRDWLDRQGLNPTQCVVIGVEGESMEPTLVEGSSILVDRSRRRRRAGRVYVVRTDDGLVVKRVGKSDDGGWLLVSDHPTWKPIRWPGDAETVGQVMWTARTLKW